MDHMSRTGPSRFTADRVLDGLRPQSRVSRGFQRTGRREVADNEIRPSSGAWVCADCSFCVLKWASGFSDAVRMSNPSSKSVLTTGEVATICKVAARTVSKWIDTGRLEGYRIPGSRDRRVTREALDRFIRDNRLPTAGIAASSAERVLVVDADTSTATMLAETLAQETGREARVARTAFEAGVTCGRFAPDWMFVDTSVGMAEIVGLVSILRTEGSRCRVVVMGHGFLAQDEAALRGAGVTQVLRKPFTLRAAVDMLTRCRYAAAG